MTGLSFGRGKVVGLTASAAVLLTTLAGGGVAQAVPSPGPSTRSTTPATSGKLLSAGGRLCALRVHHQELRTGQDCHWDGAGDQDFLGIGEGLHAQHVSVVLWPFYDDAPLSTKGVAGNYWYWDKSASGTDVKVHLKAKMTLSPKQLSNSYAGRWPDGGFVKAIGEEDLAKEDEDENVVATMADADLPLTLQRQATFGKSFNATPEPVKKGKKITLKAKLARVNWNGAKALKYVGFNGKVKVQFKVAGATTYKTVKTVQATSKGQISTTVKATKSGSWRFVFAGYSTTSPATSVADAVKVK